MFCEQTFVHNQKQNKYQVWFLCENLVNYKLIFYGLRSKNSQVRKRWVVLLNLP